MHAFELMVQLQRHMGRKKILPGRVSTVPHPQDKPSLPSLPVECGEIAIRLNQDIFRIKMEKQTNKTVMYADGILPLASLPSTLESFIWGEQKERGKIGESFPASLETTPARAMVPCPGSIGKAEGHGRHTLCSQVLPS